MSETPLLSISLAVVATLFGVLAAIIGWLGNKFYEKLDEISKNLVAMAGELHERINGIDRRVVHLEARSPRNTAQD